MYCQRCGTSKPMLLMMNTTRPERENILVRYHCTDCGMWATVIYKPANIQWHVNPESIGRMIDVDPEDKESLYFVDTDWSSKKKEI